MITVKLRLFAGHRPIVGQADLTLTLAPGTTVAALWEQLTQRYPPLARYSGHVRAAVNHEFCPPEHTLHNGDEVAYLPPVSGGAPSADDEIAPFALTSAPLDARPLERSVQTPADGALVTFAGVVRNQFGGRATAALYYEAYAEMVVPVLRQLAAEAQQRWPIGRVAVHHRVGRLAIGETAVLVVVAAPHRAEAFAAAAYVMDRIKEDVPIWKHEHWADGDSTWHEEGVGP